MFLKSLSLKGFKSFADRTTLEFEPGVAVVVGPNGAGKSNVVDAVAWVLGAQGARTLRGARMDDVIFAGTHKRPPAARAEVSLTIDNSAGLLPIAFSEVTITRTLTRDGESGYALNGEPCRLLDIAELLSDTGVGRRQHVIVGQGQLDHVLHARPEDRRSVIEEAAGILKYRQRKEKAERRLEATAANLERLTDLVREVRRHLRPLERQAGAARRHGGLVEELRAIRLHLAGREIATLSARLETLAARRESLAVEETAARSRTGELEAAVTEAEAALAALPADALGDAVARSESLLARAEGLVALVSEKRRGVERSLAALADAGVVETLTAEAAELRSELAVIVEDEAPPTRDGPSARWAAAEARGELVALGGATARTEAELARLEGRREPIRRRLARLAEEAVRVREETFDEAPLVDALASAQAAREAAEAAAAAAEARLRVADAEAHGWTARAEALALALGELRASLAGSGCLDGVAGVAGPLVDLLEIEPGAEAAVAAGLGDALRAVVVTDPTAAREVLQRLRAGEVGGVALVADAATGEKPRVPAVPPDTHPLAACVTARVKGLPRVLARLLATTVLVEAGWERALEVAIAHPELTVVTPEGDRFEGRGVWRAGGRAVGATPAAVEDARRRAAETAGSRSEAERTLEEARVALGEARRWEAAGDKALDSHRNRQAAATAALERIEAERAEAEAEATALEDQVAQLAAQLEAEASRRRELEQALPGLEEAEAEERDHDLRAAAVEERRRGLTRRLEELEVRLEGHGEARRAAEERRAALEHQGFGYAALAGALARTRGALADVHERLRDRRRERSEAARAVVARLQALRRERAAIEGAVAEARERRARVEIEEAEVRTRLDSALEGLRRDLECEPEEALAAPVPSVPEGVTLAVRARGIERELRQMGPVNPLAVEEYAALRERLQLLESQLEDVRAARRDLAQIIRGVDEEIVGMFSAAYADAEEHFEKLIATLFPGGSGRLRLTEPQDLLNAGIEIEARPSGKSVRRLSLLSGGERSLTALAFLFAVFRARPAPFYLLDEVEASLDDVNLCRFIDLVHEFRHEAQLVVVSHQKRTMEAADCLYGVSMPPGGSSIVVTQRVPAPAVARPEGRLRAG